MKALALALGLALGGARDAGWPGWSTSVEDAGHVRVYADFGRSEDGGWADWIRTEPARYVTCYQPVILEDGRWVVLRATCDLGNRGFRLLDGGVP